MANNPFFSDATVIADVAAITALLNSGFIKIYSGSQPADANVAVTGNLLVSLTFNATAFGAGVASGSAGSKIVTATANAITGGTAVGAGTQTAGYFALVKSDNSTVVAMGSVGTSGADLNLSSTSITNGASVTCSSFTITQTE